jgi:vacuolar-type H+-ATPase subunit I/STV1
MAEPERPEIAEKPVPETRTCPECGRPSKTAQGLAGHRRLAHSASTARFLDERSRALEAKEKATERKATEAAKAAEATKRREAELARRERAAREIEETPEAERVRRIVAREIASLPEVTTETVLRVNGDDYRIREDGSLEHLYWPKGKKTEFEEGQWFQFGGRAYCITDGRLRAVRPSAILAEVLGEGE